MYDFGGWDCTGYLIIRLASARYLSERLGRVHNLQPIPSVDDFDRLPYCTCLLRPIRQAIRELPIKTENHAPVCQCKD